MLCVFNNGNNLFFFNNIAKRKITFRHYAGCKREIHDFLGNHGSEKLDVFSKITFTSIYFDDEELTKDYIIFDDIEHDEISRGDRIFIEYYPNSRIVTSITRARTKTQGDG